MDFLIDFFKEFYLDFFSEFSMDLLFEEMIILIIYLYFPIDTKVRNEYYQLRGFKSYQENSFILDPSVNHNVLYIPNNE